MAQTLGVTVSLRKKKALGLCCSEFLPPLGPLPLCPALPTSVAVDGTHLDSVQVEPEG